MYVPRQSLTLVTLLTLSCLALPGHGADLYVSGSGSDSANGATVASALRTLSKAAGLVNPGDTVWIMSGTYAPFKLSRSGTSESQRITWKAYPGHQPEIVSTTWSAIDVSASYQTIDGLILTGNNDNVTLTQAEADYDKSTPDPIFNGSGISLDNRNKASSARVHNLTVRNSTIRKFGCGGVVVLEADYAVIEYNDIYENAVYARYGCSGATIFNYNKDSQPGYRNYVRANRFWNNRGLVKWKQLDRFSDGNGFILDTSATDYSGRTLIVDNLAVNNGGSGIHSYRGRNADIVNNTAYMNGWKVGYADIYAGDSVNITLKNNIAYSRVGGKANTSDSLNVNVVYDYNLYFNGSTPTMGPNDLVGDPVFVNPGLDPSAAGIDFRLKSGSPAIDSGLTIVGVSSSTDLAGSARPQGSAIDRGSYEYVAPVVFPLPAGWSAAATSSSVSERVEVQQGNWQLAGRSGSIAGTSDSFFGAMQSRSGDLEITARVVSTSATLDGATAGVTIRDSMAADARHASTLVSPVRGVLYTRRAIAAQRTRATGGPTLARQVWVRLQRKGGVLTSWSSSDGVSWTLVRRETLALASSVQVGLVVSAAGAGAGNAVTFSDVTVTAL